MRKVQDDRFDPQRLGTPERVWAEHLLGSTPWSPGDGPLLVASPHPDDEVLAAGGLMHTWISLGRAVTVVSVTDGEAAYGDARDLAAVRRDELKSALRKLGSTHMSLVRLGLPDGRLAEHHDELCAAIEPLLTLHTLLIAPYTCDGHPDHEAVGRVCCEVAKQHGTTLAQYLIWAWHRLTPSDLPHVRWGKFTLDFEAQRAKAHAVQCFASQLAPPGRPPVVPRHVLAYFQRAYEAFIL